MNDCLITESMELILKMMIPVTYLLIHIKVLSVDDKYIINIIILYKGLTIVRLLKFIQNECKKNKILD